MNSSKKKKEESRKKEENILINNNNDYINILEQLKKDYLEKWNNNKEDKTIKNKMLNFKKQLNLEEQKKDINNLINLKEKFLEI